MAKHEVCLLRFLGDNWLVVSTSVVLKTLKRVLSAKLFSPLAFRLVHGNNDQRKRQEKGQGKC